MLLKNVKILAPLFNSCKRSHLYLLHRSCTYKSSISLDKLYPESVNIKKFVPPKQQETFNGFIPIEELEISYSRSSGPGGQHVNTTCSKVDVRFHVKSAKWLSDTQKDKLLEQHRNRINKEGYFIIRSEKTRIQSLNQADAVARLRDAIFKLDLPELTISPETEEKIRKNKEKAARIRLMDKRMRSDIKSSRGI